MIVVENTKQMQDIRNVVASMAISNMPLSCEFVSELIRISNGERTTEELRQEILKKYAN